MGGIRTARDHSLFNPRVLTGLALVALGILLPFSVMAMAPAETSTLSPGAAPAAREAVPAHDLLTVEAGLEVEALGQRVSVDRSESAGIPVRVAVPKQEARVGTEDAPVDTSALPASVGISLGVGTGSAAQAAGPSVQGAAVAAVDTLQMPPNVALLAGAAVAVVGLLVWAWPTVKSILGKLLVVMPLYAHIQRDEVFNNQVRERIFGVVKGDPGVSATEVAERAGVAWGTTLYHLNVLEQNRMVVRVKDGRYLRYFENGAVGSGSRAGLMLLRNATTAKVAETVAATAGLTQKDLSARLDMTPQALHWHLQRLEAAGMVRKVREGRVVRHYAAQVSVIPAA